MVYEQEQIKEIAEAVKSYLNENHLAEEYIKQLSGNHTVGRPLPEMEEVVDNGCLRYDLICFLSYRTSIMEDMEQKSKGRLLIEDLDTINDNSRQIEKSDTEQAAWDVADLIKELDYFKYVRYMRGLDDSTDPVRRIYMDLKVPEKRAELADYLLQFADTEHREKVQEVAAKLEEMDRGSEISLTARRNENCYRR